MKKNLINTTFPSPKSPTDKKAKKGAYFAKSESGTSLRWLLMKRISEANGGGAVCVRVFDGNSAMLRARMAAKTNNQQGQ